MKLKLYQVDAFTDTLFGGNPAIICTLDQWISTELLQKIARENSNAETAFIVPMNAHYEIRWFTSETEVDLCGHATLAAAYVVFQFLKNKSKSITFKSKSGELIVTRNKDYFTLDFPAVHIVRDVSKNFIGKAIGVMPTEVWRGIDYMVVLPNEELVKKCEPNFDLIARLDARGISVTAKGRKADFVSRFFGPRVGINEDSVTGSAHCYMAPYWSKHLKKNKLYAEQLSPRLGKLYCEVKNNRVLLSGKAVPYLIGEIELPA